MDENLIEQFFLRSETAISLLEQRYGIFCRSIIRSILPGSEDAEECLNDVYLIVWNTIPPTRPRNFKSWLGVVARNAALAVLRRKRRSIQTLPLSELEEFLPHGTDPAQTYDTALLANAISDFLQKQPADHRIAFMRRYWYQDSLTDVARFMGWSTSKTKSTLFRLRNKLRATLIKEELWHET